MYTLGFIALCEIDINSNPIRYNIPNYNIEVMYRETQKRVGLQVYMYIIIYNIYHEVI